MALNMSNLAFAGAEIKTGADLFGAMLTNQFGSLMFTVLFIVICYLVNRGGISGGIEKFNKVGMPALFVMLLITIIRSLTLPHATEGLKFMFVPGYAVKAGFISEEPNLLTVFATAGGQMFFSLSLAMGSMITYVSYLSKKESLVKNSGLIVVCDTIVATMAGLAVLPAAIANGISNINAGATVVDAATGLERAMTVLFIVICYLVNRGGISGGIEKFNKVGMPALFVMLLITIIRSLTLPHATEGLKFMFVPGYAVKAGFISEEPNLLTVFATAGGQMFFSLSLAMGSMITYVSYLSKKESLVKNSGLIVVCDTIVATMAGLAVLPAAIANGISNINAGATVVDAATGLERAMTVADIKLGGPNLLFVTLQDVFNAMGSVGPLFGVIFYLLVLLAAITSAISLIEVVATYFLDRAEEKGKHGNRPKIVLWICLAVLVEAAIVAVDGLGSNGVYVPFQFTFQKLGLSETGIVGAFNDNWLDFMDTLSEGLAMPIGALLMSFMVAWEIKPKTLLEEIHVGHPGKNTFVDAFFTFSIRVIVPIGMILILAGQINDFFGTGWFG